MPRTRSERPPAERSGGLRWRASWTGLSRTWEQTAKSGAGHGEACVEHPAVQVARRPGAGAPRTAPGELLGEDPAPNRRGARRRPLAPSTRRRTRGRIGPGPAAPSGRLKPAASTPDGVSETRSQDEAADFSRPGVSEANDPTRPLCRPRCERSERPYRTGRGPGRSLPAGAPGRSQQLPHASPPAPGTAHPEQLRFTPGISGSTPAIQRWRAIQPPQTSANPRMAARSVMTSD